MSTSFPILASRSFIDREPALASRRNSAIHFKSIGIAGPNGAWDIRYTLETSRGELLYLQSRGIRHGSSEVLARLGRGKEVDAAAYTFRTATFIETAAPALDWLNRGAFIGVGGRMAGGVIYEIYLVG